MENVPTTVKKVIELLVATYSIEWCGSLGQIINEILHWLLMNMHYMLQWVKDIIFSALDAGLECISTVAGP